MVLLGDEEQTNKRFCERLYCSWADQKWKKYCLCNRETDVNEKYQ